MKKPGIHKMTPLQEATTLVEFYRSKADMFRLHLHKLVNSDIEGGWGHDDQVKILADAEVVLKVDDWFQRVTTTPLSSDLLAKLLEAERREDQLRSVLAMLLDRITSEPTMSGHLRGCRLMPDQGNDHQTSDAIRAAKILTEKNR